MKNYVVTTYNNGSYQFIRPNDLLMTSIFSENVVWRVNDKNEILESLKSKKDIHYEINELVEGK